MTVESKKDVVVIIPPNVVCLKVPIPNNIVCCLRNKREQFVSPNSGFLCLFSFGNIKGNTRPFYTSIWQYLRFRASLHPFSITVSCDDFVFIIKGGLCSLGKFRCVPYWRKHF